MLTLDKLQRRGRQPANRCFFCQENEESIGPILLHFVKMRLLWKLLFSVFGIVQVLPASIRQALEEWNRFFVGIKRKEVWRAAPLCLFRTVWKEGIKIASDDGSYPSKS